MIQPNTQMREIKLSKALSLIYSAYRHPSYPYFLQSLYSADLGISEAELNALAPHIPVVQDSLKAMVNALDFILHGKVTIFGEEYEHRRSQAIEALHAAIQGVEDIKQEINHE